MAWREIGDRVYVRRHESFDLNVGLVVGDGACLVVDTRASHAEAADLVTAIRRVTPHPWLVVNTHAHFDHYFGNAVLRPAPIWAHRRCATVIAESGEAHRRAAIAEYGRAVELSEVIVTPPDHLVDQSTTLDLGGRAVTLAHLGRGHTDNDLVVSVADAVFAGDLVEQGAPPAFEDAYPLDWPVTVGGLLGLVTGPVVPGHGDVVDLEFVAGQAAALTTIAELATAAYRAGRPVDAGLPGSPFPPEVTRTAVARAYRQLSTGDHEARTSPP